jgi:hypothetical protein
MEGDTKTAVGLRLVTMLVANAFTAQPSECLISWPLEFRFHERTNYESSLVMFFLSWKRWTKRVDSFVLISEKIGR